MPAAVIPFPIQQNRLRLKRGDAGVRQTIGYMRAAAVGNGSLPVSRRRNTPASLDRFTREGSQNPFIRALALRILQDAGVPNRDTRGELTAIMAWIKQNIAFRGERDEEVQTPLLTVQLRAGDCDDHSVLAAALLKSLGFDVRFVTVAADPTAPRDMSHVFAQAFDTHGGQWVSLDTTVDGSYPGWNPPAGSWTRGQVWPLQGSSPTLGRPSAHRASRFLGDFTPLPYPPRGGCSGSSGPSGAQITGQAAGGVGTAATILALSPATGPAAPFVAAGAAIASLFSMLLGGHSAKVKKEQQLLCAAVPAANQALQEIYSAVQSGQFSPTQGAALLDQVQQQFDSATGSMNNNKSHPALPVGQVPQGGTCNGSCLYSSWLKTAIQQCKSDFATMAHNQYAASQNAAPQLPGSGVTDAVTSFVSKIPWGWVAAAAVGGWMLLGD